MPLDPQAKAWMKTAAASGFRPYEELGVDEARRLIDGDALELFGRLERVAAIDEVDAGGVPAGVTDALVLTAEYDPLCDEGEVYAERLRQAGVTVEHARYDGMVHGFLRMPGVLDRAGDAIDQVARAVREALA